MAWPLIIAAAGVAGALFSGERGNRQRRQEAQKNRSFQERMRNTEWQAGVADMEKAGINPALAYGQGGASSPSGAVAQMENVGEGAVGTAMQVKLQAEQLKIMKATRAKAIADANIAQSVQSKEQYALDRIFAERSMYFTPHGRPTPALSALLKSEHGARMANSARSVSDAEVAKFSIAEQEAISKLFESVGQGGAGMRAAMPLLLQLMRGRN